MSKHRGMYVAGAVVAVIILILLLAPLFVNANSFRPKIEAQLQSALGRKVAIGDLSLSLLSGGIAAKDISIADDPKFSQAPFVQAKALEVGVELWPLITSRSLRVTGITLTQPELALIHSPSGAWNFSSLGSGQKTASPSAGGNPVSDFSVQKLRIVNGRVTVSGTHGKPSTYQDVNLTASDVSYSSKIPFTLDAKTPGGGTVKMEGTAGPIDRTDASLTPLSAKLAVQHMDLASTGFLDPSSGLAGVLDFNGTVNSDGRTVHSEGTAKVDNLRAVRTGSPAKQPVNLDYASDYDLRSRTGVLSKGTIHTGSSTASLTGNYDMRGDSTAVRMNLIGSRLPVKDIEGLLPAVGIALPAGTSLQGGTADANLALDGPIDRLITAGTVQLANTKLAGFDLASKMSALSAFTGLNPGADTVIQTFSSALHISPDGIRADNLNLIIPALGTLTGNGTISANNALNFRMLAKLANPSSPIGQLTSRIPLLGRGSKGSGGIPFQIQGTTAQPVFLPDIGGALATGVANPLQKGSQPTGSSPVGNVLNQFLGKKK
jgi:AsmA protein